MAREKGKKRTYEAISPGDRPKSLSAEDRRGYSPGYRHESPSAWISKVETPDELVNLLKDLLNNRFKRGPKQFAKVPNFLTNIKSDEKEALIAVVDKPNNLAEIVWKVIALHVPKSLPDVIKMLVFNSGLLKHLSGLIALATTTKQKQALLNALNQEKTDGWTGWMVVVRYAPQFLPALIEMTTKEGKEEELFKALNQENTNGRTGWMAIALYAPQTLPALITMTIEKGKEKEFLKALNQENTNGRTGWMAVALYAPQFLPALIEMAKDKAVLQKELLQGLNKQVNGGWTGWMVVARYAPQSLPALI